MQEQFETQYYAFGQWQKEMQAPSRVLQRATGHY
ncbi:hypothetical protein ACLB1M_32855 [Escherichia coli]